MKTIIITGPSGSGKTFLARKLASLYKESITINTDSYYRDSLLIKFISLFRKDIYDRLISIKKKKLITTISSLYNKEKSITFYNYEFTTRRSSKINSKMQQEKYPKFIILEGVFAHRLDLNYNNTINILCNENKNVCYKRRLIRDKIERGRTEKEIKQKYDQSWFLYFKHLKDFITRYDIKISKLNDKKLYQKIVKNIDIFT